MSFFDPASKQIQRADGSKVGNGTHRKKIVRSTVCDCTFVLLLLCSLCLHIFVGYYLSSISDWVVVMTTRQISRTFLHVRLPSRPLAKICSLKLCVHCTQQRMRITIHWVLLLRFLMRMFSRHCNSEISRVLAVRLQYCWSDDGSTVLTLRSTVILSQKRTILSPTQLKVKTSIFSNQCQKFTSVSHRYPKSFSY